MYHNILIVKLSSIGDVIHALPVAHALKQRYPDANLTWVVEKASYDLVFQNPAIDNVILFDKHRYKSLVSFFKKFPDFVKQLRSRRYDLSLDLQGLAKSAVVAAASGAKKRMGYCNMRELSHLVSSPVYGEHEEGHVVDRYLDVARAVGCDVTKATFPLPDFSREDIKVAHLAKISGFDLNNPYVVLAVGTNWKTKCWSPRRFAQLVDMLLAANITPVLIGSSGDYNLAQEVSTACTIPPANLVGKTTMRELGYIIEKSKAFVGGDTGPMHFAAALNKPIVSLFGPTDPNRNGPYNVNSIVLQAKRPCINCWRRNCEEDCLDEIQAEAVFDALNELLR